MKLPSCLAGCHIIEEKIYYGGEQSTILSTSENKTYIRKLIAFDMSEAGPLDHSSKQPVFHPKALFHANTEWGTTYCKMYWVERENIYFAGTQTIILLYLFELLARQKNWAIRFLCLLNTQVIGWIRWRTFSSNANTIFIISGTSPTTGKYPLFGMSRAANFE